MSTRVLITYLVSTIFWVSFFSLHQMTCLHLAFEGGHMNTVKYLVDKGADINTKDDRGVRV